MSNEKINEKLFFRQMMKERYYEASGKGNREIRKIMRREMTIGTIFTFMPIVVVTVFVFAAFAIALWLSFYGGQLTLKFDKIRYVGLKNWSLLFNENFNNLKKAVKNTLLFAGVTTICNVTGALIIASLLNSRVVGKKKNMFMVLYFLPQLTSGIASAIIFIKLTGKNTVFGLDLYGNPQDAIWVMIISAIWGGISGGIITFNAAFSGVDPSQYESASLDGASTWVKFKKITVPSLGPILSYTLITSLIGGMGVFDQAFILNSIGADPSSVLTWSLLGWAHIMGLGTGGGAFAKNVGLGVVTLVLLGVTIFVVTRLVNMVKPLERK